jgi:hypothetical protein
VVTVTVGVADGLPEDAQPAAVTTQANAATATAQRPALECPIPESPVPEYPVLGCLAVGNSAPGTTRVPFVCAAPHAPFRNYDGNTATQVGSRLVTSFLAGTVENHGTYRRAGHRVAPR